MKARLAAPVLVGVAVTFFMIGSATTGEGVSLKKATTDNLSTAMHGEAFAYAKYLLYAEHARQSGATELANLFESSAKAERFEHFAEEASSPRWSAAMPIT